jgi:hypothetical protein
MKWLVVIKVLLLLIYPRLCSGEGNTGIQMDTKATTTNRLPKAYAF